MIRRTPKTVRSLFRAAFVALAGTAAVTAGMTGCSSDGSGSGTKDSGVTGTGGSSSASCSPAGGPLSGNELNHCAAADGAIQGQQVGKCEMDGETTPTDAGGTDYGDTNYGTSAPDDDCKYNVSWSSTPICKNADIMFTVTASYIAGTDSDAPMQVAAGGALTGAAPYIEAFRQEPDGSVHLNAHAPVQPPPVEKSGGVYDVGPIVFDESGAWQIRFHFNEDCSDTPDDSPHGHAAFFINVP